ncbi:MAG: MotA/TolQ/ExbB proton channel family protein [Kangiellaceae bacterium]|nr:MotA/TolQ/ExbB proton channel family protein [Kangiellaceae bacterium]
MYDTIVSFMQNGGEFMYIILFVFIIGLAIAIERFIYLSILKTKNRLAWKKLLPILNQGNFRQALEMATNSNSAIGRILAYGLSKVGDGRRHDDLEMAMEEGMMEILPRLEKRTPYLATFANIATLLGLLGTIMGLIKAFTAVANVDPSEKANLLSASISVAMNTTAFGLMAAIPLLLMFTFLQTKTTEIVDSIEMASVKFVNMIRAARPKEVKPAPARRPVPKAGA